MLDIPVHETLLGERNGKIVVACKDFRGLGEELLEMRTIKNAANPLLSQMLDLDLEFSNESDFYADMDELLLHMKYNELLNCNPAIEKRFWDCMVVDILINNNDRNNGNWGLLRDANGNDRLAPVYDNGASFSNKKTDDSIKILLESPSKLKDSALNSQTAYIYGGKILTAKKALELKEISESVCRLVPKINKRMGQICEFIRQIPEAHHGMSVCSWERGSAYCEMMKIRLDYLLVPTYEKIIQKSKKHNNDRRNERLY